MEPLPPIAIVILAMILIISFVIKESTKNTKSKTVSDVILLVYISATFFTASFTMIKNRDNEIKERAQSVFDQNKAEGEVFSDQMKDYIKMLQSELTALRSFEYKELKPLKEIEFVEVRDTFYVNGDTVITIKQEIK